MASFCRIEVRRKIKAQMRTPRYPRQKRDELNWPWSDRQDRQDLDRQDRPLGLLTRLHNGTCCLTLARCLTLICLSRSLGSAFLSSAIYEVRATFVCFRKSESRDKQVYLEAAWQVQYLAGQWD